MQASPYWEVTAGYVGVMRVVLPLTSLYSEPCSLQLQEALLTVRPRQASSSRAAEQVADAAVASSPESGRFMDFEEINPGPVAILDGVKRIAGGIESMMQRLKMQAGHHLRACKAMSGAI